MSAEQNNLEQNALSAKMNQFWSDFKQGKVIGYKMMGVILILVASIGSTWYILYERNKANSREWVAFDEANSESSLKEISENYPNTEQDRLARLQIARHQLGIAGIDRLGSLGADQRKKAVESIEKARESFAKLLEDFKTDPLFKVECLLALASAEASLVAVPVKEGQLTEFRGSIPKVVEWLDQVAEAAAPGTPWATDSKKFADSLRDPKSATAHEFFRVQQTLFKPNEFGSGGDPFMPGMSPFPGGLGGFPKTPFIPGVPEPVSPGKGLEVGPGATSPPGSPGSGSVAPKESTTPTIAPPSKDIGPSNPNIAPPIAPDPKAPSKSPEPGPKAPEKSPEPAPKAPESKAPVAPPEKKPG